MDQPFKVQKDAKKTIQITTDEFDGIDFDELKNIKLDGKRI